MTHTTSEKLLITLPADLKRWLERAAERDGLSMAGVIRRELAAARAKEGAAWLAGALPIVTR